MLRIKEIFFWKNMILANYQLPTVFKLKNSLLKNSLHMQNTHIYPSNYLLMPND